MVSHSRTPARPHRVRALNTPRPVKVALAGGMPIRITVERSTRMVERVQDTWIIEDEWWRQPISRQYYALILDSGAFLTVFHDRVTDTWHAQDY